MLYCRGALQYNIVVLQVCIFVLQVCRGAPQYCIVVLQYRKTAPQYCNVVLQYCKIKNAVLHCGSAVHHYRAAVLHSRSAGLQNGSADPKFGIFGNADSKTAAVYYSMEKQTGLFRERKSAADHYY